MAFKYRGGSRTTEDVSRRSKESSGSYDNYLKPGIQKFKPREGENRIRIMPPPDFGTSPEGKEKQQAYLDKWGPNWEVMAFLHRNVGADEGTYLCPKHMRGKPCAVCEAREDADPEEADELRVQKRPFCFLIDRDNEKAGLQVWDMPMGVFREINLRSQDKRTGAVIYIDHPEEGYDVMFTREGVKKRTKYTGVEIDRDPSPIHDSESKMDRWLQQVSDTPIPALLNFYSADHVDKVLMGASKKRDDDEEEEEAPRRRKKPADDDEEEAPRRRRKPAEDEEEEAPRRRKRDEEEEEEEAPRRRRKPAEDEEEEEEAPRKRKKPAEEDEEEEEAPRKRKRSDPDEEEDEDPPPRRKKRDEEEEEEEAPRRRKRPAEDEEEEEAPRRRKRPAEDEEEEEEAPRRKKKPAEDEEDEETSAAARRKANRLKRKAGK